MRLKYMLPITVAAFAIAFILVVRISAHGATGDRVEIIDGDTIVLNGETIRLIGIDTPETVDPDKPVQCGGPEAHDHLAELLAGAEIQVMPGVEHTDSYGRTLGYVYADGNFVNAAMARDGYARYFDFPPNTKYATVFHNLVYHAIDADKGIWKLCPNAMAWATGS